MDNPEEIDEWTEDFIRQTAAQFEANLSNILGTSADGTPLTTEQMQVKFQQMAGKPNVIITK